MPRESVTSLKQKNQALKEQLDALFKEVKLLKDKCQTEGSNKESNRSNKASNAESERSLQFLSDEYDDLTAANSDFELYNALSNQINHGDTFDVDIRILDYCR